MKLEEQFSSVPPLWQAGLVINHASAAKVPQQREHLSQSPVRRANAAAMIIALVILE